MNSNGINENGPTGLIEQVTNLLTIMVARDVPEQIQVALNNVAYYCRQLGYDTNFIASAVCLATMRGMRQRAMIANGEAHVAPTGEVVETPGA